MKRNLICLLAILLTATTASAQSFGIKNADGVEINYYYIEGDESALEVVYLTKNFYSGKVVIPDKVRYGGKTYTVKRIGKQAFRGSIALTSVVIPGSVQAIGEDAFNGCSGITSLVIPGSVQTIGKDAFYGCNGLTSLTLNEGLITIGERAFGSLKGLTSLTIPGTVQTIGEDAFYDCGGLTSLVIPPSVQTIGRMAFYGCNGLTSLTLNEGLITIGEQAFDGLKGLTSLTIPGTVQTIGRLAFSDCTGLTSLYISSGVTTIGERAFERCNALTSIKVDENNSVYDSRNNCNALIHTATNTLILGCNTTFIPDGVTAIGEDAFLSYNDLKSLAIPNSVESIGRNAFYDCFNLDITSLSANLKTIGAQAFWDCESITSITIPAGVTEIEKYAFFHCAGMKSVTLPESIDTICPSAFGECYSMASINLPESLKEIGNHAFADCKSLLAIEIPSGITKIEQYTFGGCTSLASVVLPSGLTSIKQRAFGSCSSLSTISLPSTLQKIENFAFYQCENLTTVYCLGSEPIYISEDAFPITSQGATKCIPATLYVPLGSKEAYERAPGWKLFQSIVETSIEPLDDNEKIDFSLNDEIDAQTNLYGNTVGNFFFNISDESGNYSTTEGCIVITEASPESQMDNITDMNMYDNEVREQFTGIIFKLPKGTGVVKVTAETTGNMTLMVKVGHNAPAEVRLNGKKQAEFPYSVPEETLVFIYAGQYSGVKGLLPSYATQGSLKIYGIECVFDHTAINDIQSTYTATDHIFDLNGRVVQTPSSKGVYIVNGKKVLLK